MNLTLPLRGFSVTINYNYKIIKITMISITMIKNYNNKDSDNKESLWIFNSDKVYLVVLNMFLVLNFNSLELHVHVQLKFDPINSISREFLTQSHAIEMSYFFLSPSKKISSPFL